MRVIGWKAWFQVPGGDVQRFDSRTTSWADLPSDGLQRVMVYYGETWGVDNRPYRKVIGGNDFYYLRDGMFIQTDVMIDDPSEKLGRAIADEDFQKIKTEAWDEHYF